MKYASAETIWSRADRLIKTRIITRTRGAVQVTAGGPTDCEEVRACMRRGKLSGICMIFHRQDISFLKTLDLVASSVLL